MIEAFLGRIARLVSKRPGWVLMGLALVTSVALVLLPRLRIDPDVTAFLPKGDPRVELLTQADEGDSTSRRLWIALTGDNALAECMELAEDLKALPGVERVLLKREEILGLDDTLPSLSTLSVKSLDALATALQPSARRAAIADIKRTLAEDPIGGQERVLRDPLGLRWALDSARHSRLPTALDASAQELVTKDGRLVILALEGNQAPFDVAFSKALMEGVEELLVQRGFEPGVDAHLLGGYAAARSDSTRIKGDLMRSLIWSVPLVLLFLMFSSRSFVLPHLYLLPVLLAILWALGFGGALLGPLTPLALSSAAILIGLGVDFAIHFAERWREERATTDAACANLRTTVGTGRGLVAGLLTSGAAFLAFSASSLPGLVSFGALLTLGLSSALVVTLLLEPILLERFLARETSQSSPESNAVAGIERNPKLRRNLGPGLVTRWAMGFSSGSKGPAAALLLVVLGALGWGVFFVRGLHFHADPAALRPSDTDLTRAAQAIQAQLSFSPIPTRVLLPRGTAPDSSCMDRLATGAAALMQSGEAALVVGPQDVLPTTEKRKRLDQLRAEGKDLIADVSSDLLEEGLRAAPFLPALEELGQRLTEAAPTEAPAFQIEAMTGSESTSKWRVDVYGANDLSQREEREALHRAIQNAFGQDALIADPHGIGDVVAPILRHELFRALQRASLLVLLFVVIGLGSLRLGLQALLPVVLGFGLTLGTLSLFGVSLTPGNLMAIPLILGLGVDDGVHLVLRHKQSRRALATTGNAIWRTSATTALGFGSLITAQTPAIASLGAITLVGVVATGLTSLLVLPAFWNRADTGVAHRPEFSR